jgi:predicted acyltransferase (DUF342 family)
MMITESYLTYTVFALICLALLTFPFVPAFREWRYPTDFAALPISANYTSDVDHFSRRLHADVAARLGTGDPTGYEEFDFVPAAPAEMPWGKARKRLISRDSIESESPIHSVQPLYVQGTIRAAAKSAFPALYATGDIDLGADSEIDDWAHAGGVLRLGANSVALRRMSAGTAIELGSEAWFARLPAPTLHFGARSTPVPPPAEAGQMPASFADLPGAVQQTPALFLIRGDCALAAGKIYRGSLVVTGFLTIGEGTTVTGDIKSREGLRIGSCAWVQGAITCEKRIYMFKDARAAGPVISESDILIGASAVIGLPDGQTTVSARNIIVEDGAVVHGAIWAHEIGMVKPV